MEAGLCNECRHPLNQLEQKMRILMEYITIGTEGTATVVEKKSRFIADIFYVETEAEVLSYLEAKKKQYWDARHHCYAYILGTGANPIKRCSDDGEPSQTAGKPILEVMEGRQVCNCLIIVTRYFGGTLLGTGGLVRAYSEAAKQGLDASVLVTRRLCDLLRIDTDYNGIGKILYLLGQLDLTADDTDYSDAVVLKVSVPVEMSGKLQADITEATNGRAKMEVEAQAYK